MISTMSSLKTSICWNLLSKKNDQINEVGVAVYQKQTSNTCYKSKRKNEPPLCEEEADPNAAWYNLIYFDFSILSLYLIKLKGMLDKKCAYAVIH